METFLIRPNRAQWDHRGLTCIAGLLALAVALWSAYAWIGAWPILAFGAVELLGIGVLGVWVKRHLHDYERISIDPKRIVLTRATGRISSCHEFPTYWTRLEYRSYGGWYPRRLQLQFRDQAAEVGACMTEDKRDAFAASLGRALSAARSAPHLRPDPHKE